MMLPKMCGFITAQSDPSSCISRVNQMVGATVERRGWHARASLSFTSLLHVLIHTHAQTNTHTHTLSLVHGCRAGFTENLCDGDEISAKKDTLHTVDAHQGSAINEREERRAQGARVRKKKQEYM